MAPPLRMLARAAGAVVHRTGKRGLEVLVVHRPRYRDWSLPKGHLDNGESYEDAAIREVEEETGITGPLGAEIGTVGYRTRRKQKVVRYWLLEANRGEFVPNKEADKALWVPPRQARTLVSYTRDANIVRRAEQLLKRPKTSVVHLVRHANAGQRNGSKKADHKRPLSKKGIRQATTIKERLLKVPIGRIHSSNHARCTETVLPLADALDLELSIEPCLTEGQPPEHTIDFLRGLRGDAAVLCSHGDVISGTIGQLAAEGIEFDSKLEWKKASVWHLDLNKGRVIGGHYEPPPSSG